MDRRSRSIESPHRRHRNGGATSGGNTGGMSRRDYRRYSRSRSRSRERSREHNFRRRSRSRSRERILHRRSTDKDLYRDIIYDDYEDDKGYSRHNRQNRGREKGREYDRDTDRDRERERNDRKETSHNRYDDNRGRYNSAEQDLGSEDSDDSSNSHYYNKTPSSTVIVLGLQKHVTEGDIMNALIGLNMAPSNVRLIRRVTGASRGFAFVEFNTVEEAVRWMELTQGTLVLRDQTRAQLQYSHSGRRAKKSDWYCGKCGMFNFKRRYNCFKCYASREESEKGGDGSDEVSNILTKKIMLRNLDALTNEEGVLTVMEQHVPDLAKKISKILVSRDALTQTSRGICYLNFESLVDSMNLHNALNAIEPPLEIDNREVIVSYCIDHENRQIVPKKSGCEALSGTATSVDSMGASGSSAITHYTLADVPRLAEYSAALYASTPAEQAHYLQYYTEYYISEINKGSFSNLPTVSQISEASANSGAAVALSAIQNKQKKMNNIETTATQAAAAAAAAAAAVKATIASKIDTPKGNDGKVYPTPDVTLYQYDETSGYYYDPTTGLYYDAHSQYYYNNTTGAYLYWDQRKSTYVLATPAAAAATIEEVIKQEENNKTTNSAVEDESKKDKKDVKHDKVKVAKKIVKDMEKWAKQLNQKKDYTVVATPQPILPAKTEDQQARSQPIASSSSAYADVGFSILEKKDRSKLTEFVSTININNKLLSAYGGSDSDEDHSVMSTSNVIGKLQKPGVSSESDYVDFQKLTCLLCKRAFQSLDILQKHLKMSNLHKENLQKYNLSQSQAEGDATSAGLSYRDRAKERRLKYGESDPPPPNRTRERFETEIKNLTSRQMDATPSMPISSNNVGNRLLQKMGWSEGQGLGRKNQGRTNIIEAEARSTTAGLGTKPGIGPGDDYKTYIKKMMKSRYESV
ncbi:RNA-binding protein 5-A [Teleopsis dalmanni]|uniref:RNA-binding protein 5-A n=1 Tax=Teleopsis dalmanni TaxID=139649 RepID=UPI0018CEB863|nr:RNA-binding protein 5-A [Teleopsis dalmanni]